MSRILLVFAMLSAFAAAWANEAKVDEAIPMTGDSFRPVFVRMEDQLFRKAGDHEAFCKKHGARARSQNRKEVTALLQKKADESWKKAKGLVAELEKEEGIRGARRFWIVNGFACAAKPSAIKKLAEHEAVSFVYLNRFARPATRPRPMSDAQGIAMKGLFELWQKKPADLNWRDAKITWNLKEIKAPEAWRKEKAFGQGVTVAVIDSGVLPTPSLAHALWRNQTTLRPGSA